MRSILLCVLIIALLLAVPLRDSHGDLNPHVKPEPCMSCHEKVPGKDDHNFFLLKDTIDDTCHICHEKKCCKPGSLHGGNHPSNVNTWDLKLFTRPKTLPLFDGYITCTTCHFHSYPEGESYKMVRIIKFGGPKPDWAGLCWDCHVDY